MTPPAGITGLRHRTDHIGGGVPCRTPELAMDYDAGHFAFDVERKPDGAADGAAVPLGRALSSVLAQPAGRLAEMTAAGFARLGPFNAVQDLSATLVPGQGYSYRLRPVNAAGETGPWTAWLAGVAVKAMGVPAIDALFDSPGSPVAPYRPVSRSGTPFPSHRIGVLHLMAWNGGTGAAQVRNLGLSTDGSGGYDMAAWFANFVDPLGELGLRAMHIFRGPWGANLYAKDPGGSAFGIWNMPGGVNADGNPQITGLLTPAEMIRRHGHDSTAFDAVPGVGSGAFGASGYLATWMDEVPARIAAGHTVQVYMAGPPRGVSDDWAATVRSPLVAGIPLATGCTVSMDTFSSLRRDETVVLAGLESVNPAWLLLEYLRSVGYQPGWEPPTRREKNPDIGGANKGPDFLHATTDDDGSGASRWQLFQRLAGGPAPTDFPGLDELLTADADRTGYACPWLQPGAVVPANIATPGDNLKTTLADAAAVHAYTLAMLASGEGRFFPVVHSHATAAAMWAGLDTAQRAALISAAEVTGGTMADSARIDSTIGDRLMLKMDPNAGSWTQPATVDTVKLADITITASGGAVTVVEVREPDKYPFADLVTNQVFLRMSLSREIRFGETVTVDIPASLVSDGTRTNAASTGLAVTNRSYEVEGVNPNALLGATAPITYVDPTGGNDTLAAVANGGLGYYVKADVGSNAAEPSITVQPYKTWYAAFTKARNSTSTSNISQHGCVLIKRGEVVLGATDYLNTGKIYGSTGGTAYATPFVVGQYGTSGSNPELRAQQTAVGGASRAVLISGPADQSYVVFLGVNLTGGVDSGGNKAPVLQFSSNSGATRENYLFKRCFIDGNVYWNASNAGYRQFYNGFNYCVFQGDITDSSNGGTWSSNANWNDFMYRGVDVRNCLFQKASNGGFHHGLYVKSMGDLDIANTYYYKIGGSPNKLDGVWGSDVSDCVFVKTNNIGNCEANGDAAAGLPTDRTKDAQTTEYPTTAASGGAFAKWQRWRRNIMTDALAFGEQGSARCGILGFIGPSHDCTIEDILAVLNSDNSATGFIQADDGGSSNGYVKDTWDFTARRVSLAINGTSSRTTRAWGFNPADDDSFSPTGTDQVGLHGVNFHNIVAMAGSNRSTVELAAFGVEASDQDYGTSYTAGRSQLDWDYNCFYAANGYTNAFRNGGSSDLFSDLASFVTDMNAVDTSMTGNRAEDPGFVDPTYEISDYLVTGLGYADLDAAFDAIADAIIAGSIPDALTTATIASYVLPKYAHSLTESNYNSQTMGFEPWVGAEPEPEPGGAWRRPPARSRAAVRSRGRA